MAQTAVRAYWEREPCGTSPWITGEKERQSAEWFKSVERHRYEQEPHIPEVVRFERGKGARLLEIGVGAGVDHVQWAKAGAVCPGVDLTDAAIEATRSHLALHGLHSELKRVDAEVLPFADASVDVVVANLAIHNISSRDGRREAISEIARVLKFGGQVALMDFKHVSQYSEDLKKNGMSDTRASGLIFWIFPPVRVARGRKV